MCGICGILHSDPSHVPDHRDLEKMLNPIIHRGPDDSGVYIRENLGFGFRRLSIIDLQGGHQPMSNEDGTIWIVFNGEIYNFQDLRKDLIAKGHVFRTNSDTETIIHLYEELGSKCVEKLRGMFAFAIWDANTKTLFCARDRFGIKPFFYYRDSGKFLFASEIKSILPIIGIPPIDLEVFDYYLTFGYSTPDRTIYRNIYKIPPGHTMTIKRGSGIHLERYWNIQFAPDYSLNEAEWSERIIDKLKEAIKLRLISDVPLGAFLSGGIDSSSVVAIMAGLMDQPVKTFSIGFADKEFNELPYAKDLATKYGTDHHELIIEPQSIDTLPLLVQSYDEPFADASAIPTYYVSKFAREHVTVALSGDGGDELFAGYDHYKMLNKIRTIHNRTNGFLVGPGKLLHHLIPRTVKGHGMTYYLSRPSDSFAAYFAKWKETERAKAYRPEIWQQLNGTKGESVKKAMLLYSTSSDFLSKMQELDMRTWLADDILTKVDRASMSNSLEVRVPLLDHEFAELTFKIPPNLRLKGNTGKYIFKQSVAKLLPDSIISQRKKGFSVPLKNWFKQDLNAYLNDHLCSQNGLLSHFLSPKYIRDLVKDSQTSMRDLHPQLWSLIFLNEWLKTQNEGLTTINLSK